MIILTLLGIGILIIDRIFGIVPVLKLAIVAALAIVFNPFTIFVAAIVARFYGN